MTLGLDARSLVGNPSGVGNYLRGVLASDAFTYETRGYTATAGEIAFDGPRFTRTVAQPFVLAERALGPAQPIWWLNLTLRRALRHDNVDCYFGPNFLKPARCSLPSVIVVHDLVHRVHPEVHTPLYRWYLRAFLPNSIRTADHILVVSESTKQDLHRLYDVADDRVTVAPPAADDRFTPRSLSENERQRLREAYDLPEEFLLYVGNIEPRKNLSTVVDALRKLPETDRLPLVIVGQHHVPAPELERRLNADWADSLIHRAGYVPDSDLPKLYNMATAFVYPSVYEGFGIPPLEAMQSGTPVITSNRSSLPEVVGDAGVTVDPTDVSAFATAITDVCTDDAFATELRTRGLNRAQRFTWESTGRTVQRTIDAVLEEA
ncbi:glycosyltransferase family 1 protein [Haloferax sp. Atlit-6N]|uniref:glycosyltransferase family 4 protein n=1 Tax=Haloferax sp. Atlit-6N TaxID=2077205 RepID=UPI000E26A2C6|nr:glycosyltransferase family 1 protein [Haloferax sp. Atlit-6N]REA02038.1 glycosyltransferase family 1 protein [Haloferax sp. Atlit-6N]